MCGFYYDYISYNYIFYIIKLIETINENNIVEVLSKPGHFNAPKLLVNVEEGKIGLSKEKSSFELKDDNGKKW